MSKEAKRIYRDIFRFINEADAGKAIDKYLVVQAAATLARIFQAEEAVAKNGPKVRYKNGTENVSADYVILSRERKAFITLCRELGLSPKAREAIVAFAKAEEDESDIYLAWSRQQQVTTTS